MQTKNIKMSAIFASGLCSHVRQIQTVLFKRKQKNFFFFFFFAFRLRLRFQCLHAFALARAFTFPSHV